MKKKYIVPIVKTIALPHITMLFAGSGKFNVNNDDAPVDPEDTW
jgi:hypothetical protein